MKSPAKASEFYHNKTERSDGERKRKGDGTPKGGHRTTADPKKSAEIFKKKRVVDQNKGFAYSMIDSISALTIEFLT